MKIKTQLIICIVTFTILFSIIAISVATTEQQLNNLSTQKDLLAKIQTGVSSLNSIAIDYFLYQEDNLQPTRWSALRSSLSNDIAKLQVNDPKQQMLANNIEKDLQNLDSQFSEVVKYLRSASRNVSVRIDPAFQIRWSSMAVQSQTLAYDTAQLIGVIDDQAHQTNETNSLLIVSLITAFGALLATIYFILFRKTLKSVSDLQTGINKIGSGDLDYVIVTKKNDEISELSQSFNQMTAKLKAVTASKSDLEEAQKKLGEYASQMEELAEQRAKQLQNSERLAAIGATAGMVGHDIRNPLQAIVSDIYLARQELKDTPESEVKEGIKESLDSIENNVFYINKIVADLQDFAKPLNPQIQETDIKAIIEEAIANSSIPKNITTHYEVASDAQKVVADPDFLKRIMVNLTLNAIQAMPNGGKITILTFREKQTGEIILTVKDTGVGIPDDVKDKLFTPMFTTKPKGQGFGLAVIKRLTERLGGSVTFESQPGTGTTFIIHLPAPKK